MTKMHETDVRVRCDVFQKTGSLKKAHIALNTDCKEINKLDH